MWDNVGAATWSFLELTTGAIAACLPTLKPVFLACMPRLFGSEPAPQWPDGHSMARSRGVRWNSRGRVLYTLRGEMVDGGLGSEMESPRLAKTSSSLRDLRPRNGDRSTSDEEEDIELGKLEE